VSGTRDSRGVCTHTGGASGIGSMRPVSGQKGAVALMDLTPPFWRACRRLGVSTSSRRTDEESVSKSGRSVSRGSVAWTSRERRWCGGFGPIMALPLAEWRRVVICVGPEPSCAQARRRTHGDGGSIINITSLMHPAAEDSPPMPRPSGVAHAEQVAAMELAPVASV